MQDFTYHHPTTIEEAVAALEAADDGKILSGGQSLLPVMKLDMAQPSDLVDVEHVEGLKGTSRDSERVWVGASSTHAEVADDIIVRNAIPALAKLAGHIGDPQVRNRGTLGGSVAHNDPAADYPAALLALDAVVETHRRKIPAADFFSGYFETALEDNELIVGVSFRIPECAAYAKFRQPASLFALAGVFVARFPDGVRVAVTGAAAGVFRATALETALQQSFSEGALDGVAVPTDELISDPMGSADYRAHLIGVMARRAVAACR